MTPVGDAKEVTEPALMMFWVWVKLQKLQHALPPM